jgi:hypothetical protein
MTAEPSPGGEPCSTTEPIWRWARWWSVSLGLLLCFPVGLVLVWLTSWTRSLKLALSIAVVAVYSVFVLGIVFAASLPAPHTSPAAARISAATSPQGTSRVSPTSSSETETNAPVTTTPSLPAATGNVTCGDPHAHVYSPDRLQLLAACVTVTGTVDAIRVESDGDLHVLLKLDPGQDKYINSKNISAESGDLVLEPVCVDTPTQADAVSACAGYKNPLIIPAVGTHVAVTGAWVLDLNHGWTEIHPVAAFNGTAASPSPSPSPSPTPSPSSTPISSPSPSPPPAVNLCGAPANPWNYTFCGGNRITAPDADFCSYFNCISSFWKGTGYVVQCGDGTFSKSGGHTGVCSTHGGFKRNLYSP